MIRRLVLVPREHDTLLARAAKLSSSERSFRIAMMGAGTLHMILVSLLADAHPAQRRARPRPVTELSVELPPPPETASEPPRPEPPLEVAAPVPRQRPTAPVPASRPTPAAPAAAAAPVLTRADDSEEPLDLTDSIVTGTAATFRGGVTSTLPPAKRVEGPGGNGANGTRADRGAGNLGPASGPDQSHPPRVLGAMAWDCPFPSAADVDGVNNALATIRVEVDATGKVSRVHVLKDPGHGFGDAARHCAALKRWEPAAGRDGRAVAGGINVSVRFTR